MNWFKRKRKHKRFFKRIIAGVPLEPRGGLFMVKVKMAVAGVLFLTAAGVSIFFVLDETYRADLVWTIFATLWLAVLVISFDFKI